MGCICKTTRLHPQPHAVPGCDGVGLLYLFESLDQVRDITADWTEQYNEIRPHDALGSLPPAGYRKRLLAAEIPV